MLSQEPAPVGEDWAAVADAIGKRMRELKFSRARLARESGVSEIVIRYLGQHSYAMTHSRSTLVALSAALRWQPDHLANILAGYPGRNAQPLEEALLEALSEKVGKLRTDLRAVEALVDRLRSEYTPPARVT